MNLSKKLLLTTFLPIMMVLASGVFAVVQTNKMLENFAVANDTYDTNSRAALELQVDLQQQIHEWKNVLIRGNDPADRKKYWDEFLRKELEIDIDATWLITSLGESRAVPMIREFLVKHKRLGNDYRRSLGVFLGSHYDIHKADSIIRGVDRELAEDLRAIVQVISEESDAFSRHTMEEAWHTAIANFIGMFATLLIAFVLFLSSLKKYVLVPIKLLSNFAYKFGAGNYSQHINFKSSDEFGTLTDTFNHASKKIGHLIDSLQSSKVRYGNLIEGIDAVIWEWDPKTDKYTFVSQHAEELLGYSLSTWLEEPKFMEKYCHPHDLPACQKIIRNTLESGETGEYNCRAVTATGAIIWFNNHIKLIEDEQGKGTLILGVMVDTTKMKLYEDKMAYLSTHSELTGLANRNLLEDRLERAITHANGAKNITALLLVNIDRFKLINESLGHKLGDEVIKFVAQRLQKVVGLDDTLAHLGADEFALVLRDIAKPEDVAEVARKSLHQVSAPMRVSGHALVTTCSIGVSIYPKDGSNGAALLTNAGSALTRVKQTEKNNFKFYTEEMNAMALASLQLENKMRSAIDRQEFELYYQPQINLSNNRIIGAEALLRWIPPGEPMVSPMSFIPLAEETNLIIPIGEWVIRQACRQNKAWQDKGFSPICVAVNLAASQFTQPNIIELVAGILKETGLQPHYLELEITESVMMHDYEMVINNLEGLHKLGVKLAIDDFGTGYSSLSYLKRLPIDKLKVDKSFVQDISIDSDDEAIVAAIIAMAHSLTMGVIAEGVETEAQLLYLRDKGCDEVQGYYYSKPLTVELFESYLLGEVGV